MAVTGWNFFIMFQYYKGDNQIIYDLMIKEIQDLYSTCNISFYILKYDEVNNKICFYKTNATSTKLKIELESVRNVNNFYKFPFKDAKDAWKYFFQFGNGSENKNFLLINGHGAGLGFTPKYFSSNGINISKEQYLLLSNEQVDLNTIYNDIIRNHEKIGNKQSIFNREFINQLELIPLSVLIEQIQISQIKKFDFICLANCFMQSIENGYILNKVAEYLISGEGLFNSIGLNLSELFNDLSITKDKLLISKNIIKNIDAQFDKPEAKEYFTNLGIDLLDSRNGFSLSVNNLSHYETLKRKINEIAIDLLSIYNDNTKKEIIYLLQVFRNNEEFCKDVYDAEISGIIDLCNYFYCLVSAEYILGGTTVKKELEDSLRIKLLKFCNIVQNDVIVGIKKSSLNFNNHGGQNKYAFFPYGLSVFFPKNSNLHTEDELVKYLYSEVYTSKNLTPFLKNNKWFEFVQKNYNSTPIEDPFRINFIRRILNSIKNILLMK